MGKILINKIETYVRHGLYALQLPCLTLIFKKLQAYLNIYI